MTTGLLFPGQGSQEVGMGKALADRYPEAARTFEEADDVLGTPLSRVAWEGPEDELRATRNAQPALLVHSVAAHRVVADRLGGVAAAAGHSLGEFSAHVAAGTLSFAEALRAVRLRGELMWEAGQERPGAMAAVLGLDDGDAETLCRETSTDVSVVVPANLNARGQIVLSGDREAVERAGEAARSAGAKRVVPLNVSGAFHSPLMEPAEAGLREGLAGTKFHAPAFPVISNVTAEPVRDGKTARDLLVRQLTSPVRWADSVASMLELGVERFVELGAGSVLCGLNKRNARGVPCVSVGDPDEVETLDEEG